MSGFLRSSVLAVLMVGVLGACGGTSAKTAASPGVSEARAPEAVASLESRLLGARSARLRFSAVSEGAFEAKIEGTLLVGEGGRAKLDAEGTFGGEAVSLRLVSDGSRMRGGSATKPFAEQPTPPALSESLWIGLTRMGILHNLARLVAGKAPDHADGTVKSWVEVKELPPGPEVVEIRIAVPMRMAITVGGEPAGEASLWLNGMTGLPLERHQVVHFPEGEMRVVERYSAFEVDVALPEDAFR